uniref:Transposase n=1 Tax=Chenopodium quinoa TaxID=63459 RepID=A0A803L0H7_CHEQI
MEPERGLSTQKSSKMANDTKGIVIGAVAAIIACSLAFLNEHFVKPQASPLPSEIQNNPRFFPWFEDFIGAIDGTHIRASVPIEMQGRFRGRKGGTTQNMLGAVDFDMKFTYVLAGWEGSAHDSKVLQDALKRGFKVPKGKYYLADAGYGERKGFMPPYRRTRYHLKEYTNNPPENERELFNLRHSSLRMVVERSFGVLKKRFRVLDAEPFWPYETQVDVVLACCVLHNYLRGVDPNDPITREVEVEMTSQDLQHMGEARTQGIQRQENQQIERKRNAIATAMWTVKNEEKKANFRWSKDMSKELLNFLAEEVKKGNRPNNTFRTSSFVAAAKIISEKFQTNCTSEHVENHMKTVRNAWVAISTVRNSYGFGWNDNLKMVTTSPTAYATYVKEYPKYEKFFNRKIDMYEEMAIVVGKDLARGNFSKTFSDIDVDASMESGQPSMTIDSVPSKAESKADSGTSSGSRPH